VVVNCKLQPWFELDVIRMIRSTLHHGEWWDYVGVSSFPYSKIKTKFLKNFKTKPLKPANIKLYNFVQNTYFFPALVQKKES